MGSAGSQSWLGLNKREVASVGLQVAAQLFARDGFAVSVDDSRGRTRLGVARPGGPSYRVHVRTVRPGPVAYAYFTKADFQPATDLLAILVVLDEGHAPAAYLIPAWAWKDTSPLLRNRDYVGRASAPEWGIQITGKSRPLLAEFTFGRQSATL